MTEEYLISEIDQLKRENAELVRQLKIRDELSCGTCHGVGSVMIAIDDGMECPECEALDNKIKADAVIEAANKVIRHNESGFCIHCSVVEYANKLRKP